MCGFAGFVVPGGGPADELRAAALAMGATLAHRGPDDEGLWLDPEAGAALAFRRLAIIDRSPAGHQPMVSADGRWVVAYNGEIYNHRALRAELDYPFRGHADTEVLLAAVAAWGVDAAVRRLAGMFAFALWDRRERELHLGRDRLGVKPLYAGCPDGRTWLFGSELRALARHPSFERRIDRDALAAYLAFAYVPAPLAIYRGVEKLIPGTILTVGAAPRRRSWFDLGAVARAGMAAPLTLDDDALAAALDAEVGRAVARRLEADVPLGAFLSGGIDSSLVVAHMQARASRPVRTFSIGFTDPSYDEARHARRVAAHLGTDHTELIATEADAQAVVADLGRIHDEPFADSSQLPTLLVSRLARRSVTVALSGDGGDELFAGYTRYTWIPRVAGLAAGWPRLQRAAKSAIAQVPAGVWDAVGRAARPLRIAQLGEKVQKLGRILPFESQRALYDAVVRIWRDVPMAGAAPPALPRLAAADLGLDGVAWMMAADQLTYLPDDILAKVDRASMSVGLEAREPLLDHELLAFAWRIPPRHRRGKRILRRALHRHVPRELVERPKMGFGIPLERWLRSGLRPLAEDALASLDESLLDPAPIRRLWRRHLDGAANHQHELWAVIMLQLWLAAA
jgi:asparagine synthase (glutamine-hydrolysing)